MAGCWKCVDRPLRADESRLLCAGCSALNAGLGSADLATFGSYQFDEPTNSAVPNTQFWIEPPLEGYVYASEENNPTTSFTGNPQVVARHHPEEHSPDNWVLWTNENNSHSNTFDLGAEQVWAPAGSSPEIHKHTENFPPVVEETLMGPFGYQTTPLENHSSLFLDFPWQSGFPDGLPILMSPIRHQGSDAHGEFEIPGTPRPRTQFEDHNTTLGPAISGMSYGQSSLYQALFSLEYTSDDSTARSSTTHDSSEDSPTPIQPSLKQDEIVEPGDRDEDPDGVTVTVCGVLSLDPRVESNSLPFVLQSYANWMTKTMFDPSRTAHKTRDFITRRYIASPQTRSRMILTANLLRAAVVLDVNFKPMLRILTNEIRRTLIQSRDPSVPLSWDSDITLSSPLHFTLELNMFYLFGPLHEALQVLSDIAPVIRRMCAEPMCQHLHLPSLLAHPDTNVRGYPAIDILYSMLTGLPTQLKYDATIRRHADRLGHTDPLATWLIGQPSELTLILARITSLHHEFGIDIDPHVIEEIESDIRDYRPDPGISADPSLTVTRLVVLEAWRQVGYINLYMRLCGETALGPRVQAAQRRLVDLVANSKPSYKVNLHLSACLGIAGLAATRPEERSLILARLQSLPHSRSDSFLNRGIQMLRDIWTRTASEGRPAQWSDLRVAARRIFGI